ncbi:M24 family metallopeptidase [Rathayibacter sp. Leaf296]|uniref:M24 family metallopeptidase n=1 Tax=Rathayibacter sp. Leaf296 TaxID=1736327 RepID=UPI0007031069|nr:M24 family metallopeptidase [Rathayibacter sp. Leaf296]KQQ08240.1 hypothetical protein ASF46_12985 [Rathayibacter sp. Leaf296]
MTAHDLDALLVFGAEPLGGYGDFLVATGLLPPGKGALSVVRRTGRPVVVTTSEQDARVLRAADRAGGYRIVSAGVDPLPTIVVSELLSVPVGRVAVLGDRAAHRLVSEVTAALPPDLSVVDGPDLRSLRRVLGPPDELALDEAAARVRDGLLAARDAARPGATERGVAAAAHAALVAAGAVTVIVQVEANGFHARHPTGTVLAEGDVVTVFVEAAGIDGWWIEAGGPLAIGAVPVELRRAMSEITDAAARPPEVRAGGRLADTARRLAEATTHLGPPSIGIGHLSGIDEVAEALRPDSEAAFAVGDLLCVHPSAQLPGGITVAAASTALVTEEGARALVDVPALLHTTPSVSPPSPPERTPHVA